VATDPTAVRVAVQQLLAEYAAGVDIADVHSIAQLFAEDGVFAVGENQVRGREAIREFFGSAPIGIHLGGQVAVRIGDDGRSASTVQNFFYLRDGSNATVRGVYRDQVRDEGDRWRFVQRRVEIRPAETVES
jgi:uncharacterized protein (TIGR02246 family)